MEDGHIASDPDIDYKFGSPAFIIDATTRHGMSGSPVVIRSSGAHWTSTAMLAFGDHVKFLGIYSGRIRDQAELGRVWRPSVLTDMFAHNTPRRRTPHPHEVQG